MESAFGAKTKMLPFFFHPQTFFVPQGPDFHSSVGRLGCDSANFQPIFFQAQFDEMSNLEAFFSSSPPHSVLKRMCVCARHDRSGLSEESSSLDLGIGGRIQGSQVSGSTIPWILRSDMQHAARALGWGGGGGRDGCSSRGDIGSCAICTAAFEDHSAVITKIM